jgi:lysophospholipid acyltransferase (LPLAT)-like uncharacterized protein
VRVRHRPKGPSRHAKPGALFLAANLGWPVVPVAFHARPCRELSSWDRFMVPWPFAKIGIASAPPLQVEPEADAARLDELCLEVDRRMQEAERVAESLTA